MNDNEKKDEIVLDENDVKKQEDKIPIGIDNSGQIVVKNRAYRRRWRNRAELEGLKSKKFYTKKRNNGKKSRKSKKHSK